MTTTSRTAISERVGGRAISVAGVAGAALSLILLALVALRAMNYETRLDEELFVPPARLLFDHALYTGFFYNHTPGSAWLFHLIVQLSGTDHLLLAARTAVVGGWVLFAVGIYLVAVALTRSGIVSACIVVLTLFNELFLTQTGMAATNNFLPLPLSFLGLGLFVLAVRQEVARPMVIAAAGFLLALAADFKINAVAFILPVAIAAFFVPRAGSLWRQLRMVVLPLGIGGLVGGVQILYYFFKDPQLFLAHIVYYHTGPHAAFWRQGGMSDEGAVISLPAKMLLAYQVWFASAIAIGITVALALLIASRGRDQASSERTWLPDAAETVVVGAVVFAVAFCFIPTPGFPQYFALPLVCLPLVMALPFARLNQEIRANLAPVLVAAAAVCLVVAMPRLLQYAPTAVHPARWTVSEVHEQGVAIAEAMQKAGLSGKVATLYPIYPLEGGLDVYPELATGPFLYRTADVIPPALATYYRLATEDTVGNILASDPPAALLLGFDPDLERPMLEFAQANGYVTDNAIGISNRYGQGILYLKPSQSR